ncbi:hypothetical protein TWF569_000458 [Orbilia oligospora]|uniref:Inhibitor I9 domain-containing protein n=1 Tax=Orbilia oligospora TaxID=2813651 RepID=A0A7C8JJ85_ORBOL|nr:hypothetical protein TWF102_008631 [Orbilia oligospora]KAF3094884.1 hypothetical protein TWF706_008154 [Orbilia oligospora]KAF3113725.1 hypothetical protein TWF103_002074 [Orbilia oligospora]KAF3126792.1 hypothetical protein TWF569_000458 [Orbilia oligospora]KAF3127495.1 hypothetical protein TWF703_009962 [Orbilia oligospora]
MQIKFLSFLICLFVTFVSAAAIFTGKEGQVDWVVSFKDGTPQSIIDFTVKNLKEAGAEITHEFSIIEGFVIKATEAAVKAFQGLEGYAQIQAEWKPTIEQDGPVTAFGGGKIRA